MELSLNLPAQYIDIEQQEMMYLDGGQEVTLQLWGYKVWLSKKESENFQYALGQVQVGAASFASISFYLGAAGGILGGALVGGYYKLMQDSLKRHTTKKGVVLHITWANIFWSEGR